MARGDILLLILPESDKREKKGTRPAIAVQADDDRSPMLMVIPVTSSLGALRFAFTVEIPPSEIALDTWYRIAKAAEWQTLVELGEAYPSADLVLSGLNRVTI